MARKKKVIETEQTYDFIVEEDIAEIMQSCYINYAISVIISRALPDVRDGMKPVHRRILYAMMKLGLTADGGTKKSARIVGDCLGKYHPHGDTAVYDAMVRLAQEFSMRYPLVLGQGNFGTIDGDSAAAMRYTEATLSHLGEEMLADIDKGTVPFMGNFDETLQEPMLLPSKFPYLLTNGTSGIAVGVATNMAPHNLTEVSNAIIHKIDNPNCSPEDLIKIVKAPDFPTGGIIVGLDGVREAYLTGKGKVVIRATSNIVNIAGGKQCILITEIPYGVNKPNTIDKIVELMKNDVIDTISDIRDESSRDGIQIAIELKRGVNANNVLAQLYKLTDLESNFYISNIAIVDGGPKVLTLEDLIVHYIEYRREVVLNRTKYDLTKSSSRLSILNALIIVSNNIDEVISIIKRVKKTEEAKAALMSTFKLTEEQAKAILEIRLQRLVTTEVNLIKQEIKELKAKIKYYESLLKKTSNIDAVIKEELLELVDKYGDKRRTKIMSTYKKLEVIEVPQEVSEVVVLVTNKNNIAYVSKENFLKGNLPSLSDETIVQSIECLSDSKLSIFTSSGKVYSLGLSHLSEVTSKNKKFVDNLEIYLKISNDSICGVLHLSDTNGNLLLVTSNGMIKNIKTEDVLNLKQGTQCISLKEANLISVFPNSPEVLCVSKQGMSIRFSTDDIRPTGRTAAGVGAMKLSEGDELVSAMPVIPKTYLLVVDENDKCKKTKIEEYLQQKRNGKGVLTLDIKKSKTGIKSACLVSNTEDILLNVSGKMTSISTKKIKTDKRVSICSNI